MLSILSKPPANAKCTCVQQWYVPGLPCCKMHSAVNLQLVFHRSLKFQNRNCRPVYFHAERRTLRNRCSWLLTLCTLREVGLSVPTVYLKSCLSACCIHYVLGGCFVICGRLAVMLRCALVIMSSRLVSTQRYKTERKQFWNCFVSTKTAFRPRNVFSCFSRTRGGGSRSDDVCVTSS